LINCDPFITEFTVIPGCKTSVIEANPLGGAAIVVGPIALWTIFCRRQFDSFFPAVLEEWTSPMSFTVPCPILSSLCFLLPMLELFDQHLRRDSVGMASSLFLQVATLFL
jgi:hypothetical protein